MTHHQMVDLVEALSHPCWEVKRLLDMADTRFQDPE